jgi:hypothetical protein
MCAKRRRVVPNPSSANFIKVSKLPFDFKMAKFICRIVFTNSIFHHENNVHLNKRGFRPNLNLLLQSLLCESHDDFQVYKLQMAQNTRQLLLFFF